MKGKAIGQWWSNSSLALVIRVVLVLLAGDFLMRFTFFAFNSRGGWDFSAANAVVAFLVGIRFDLATIAIFNGLLLIMLVVPAAGLMKPKSRRFLLGATLILHFPVLLLNGIDVVYFGTSSKRMSHELFSGTRDLANIGVSDILPFWWLALIVFGIFAAQWWMLLKDVAANRESSSSQRKVFRSAWLNPILAAALLFLAFRGGLQHRPLHPAKAFVGPSLFLGNVGLNSAYTVISSIEIGPDRLLSFMEESVAEKTVQQLIRNDFDGSFSHEGYPLVRRAGFSEPEKPLNVVIMVLESFNANKIGRIRGLPQDQSLTPNFDSLSNHGRLFSNFFSNGSRSIESLPSILNSMPAIFHRPTIGSSYETNVTWGLGQMLGKRGYHNSFLCGGPNGTMGFDAYCTISGIPHYFGQDDYPGNAATQSSNWGIHDRPVLRWLSDLQNSFPKPFLSVWFSISNHHPFALPQDCPREIASSDLSDMDKTIRYTDLALGEYFSEVMLEPWAAQTVFVITADHCFYYPDDPDRGDIQNFHVPLLLIGPGVEPGIDDRVGSHISILPTLIELLRLNTLHSSSSPSMLSKTNAPYCINNLMGFFSLRRADRSWSTTFERVMDAYHYVDGKWISDPSLGQSEAGEELDRQLRALFQVFTNTRIRNSVCLPFGMGN